MLIGTPEFSALWTGRPVLVVSGKHDDRVPIDYVKASADMMSAAKIDVTFTAVEDADHFLLFSHRQQVIRAVIEWLRPQLRSTPASS
jgi:pimeloyl-ACP methyl ester carboxylesterase